MNPTKQILVLAVTFFACGLALRVTSPMMHLESSVTPYAIPPIVFNPNTPAPSKPTTNTPPPTTTPQAGTTSPATQSPQSGQTPKPPTESQPHSIPPIQYPTSCSNGKIWSSNDLNCICPQDKPYTDIAGQCVACLAPQFWVIKFSKCMTCPPGFESDKIEGRCYCPKDKPYIDSKVVCQPCATIWDYSTKTCLNCQNNQTFNNNTKKCECQGDYKDDGSGKCASCPSPAVWDVKNKKCVRCPQGFSFDQNTSSCACPKDKPYLDGNNVCQACNGEWNDVSFTCKTCDANQTWNSTAKKCECQGESFNDAAGKCVACPKPASWDPANKKCVRCPEGFIFDQKISQCACPSDKPYLDANNNCQSCTTKWDNQNLKCLVCAFGTVWNNATQKCDEKCLYQLVNGKCQCPQDKPILNQSTQSCKPCEKETPVWNGKECKACPPNSAFVAASKTCVYCVQGMKFNEKTQNCQAN